MSLCDPASLRRIARLARREVSCGKIRHNSLGAADRARLKQIANGAETPDMLTAYWCEWCDGFHVGNSRPPRYVATMDLMEVYS